MPAYREITIIKPNIIKWLILSHGFKEEELGEFSNRAKIKPSRLEALISEKSHPLWLEIERMSDVLHINPYLFYLKEEIDRFSNSKLLPKDYRRAYKNTSPESLEDRVELTKAVNKVRTLQNEANELTSFLDESPNPELSSDITLNTNAEEIASKIRTESSISKEKQKSCRDEKIVFNLFRSFIESKNILVFDINFKSKITRGFSLADAYPFVIVIRHSDTASARIFTLLHEYGHLLIRQGGLCGLSFETRNNNLESWCNRFAAEFIMPKAYFEEDLKSSPFSTKLVGHLAKEYKVSREAVLIKLKAMGKITDETFHYQQGKIMHKSYSFKPGGGPAKKGSEGRNFANEKINEVGQKFISLTNRSLTLNKITYRDALNLIDVKEKIYEKIRNISK